MSNFANFIWVLASTLLFVAYLFVMFQIVVDLFRDPHLSGGKKAAWILGLLFVPIITALIYVLVRGKGMAERQRAAAARARQEAETYIREVAGSPSSVDQIERAKSLLDAGAISSAEFDRLKQNALQAGHA